MHKKRLFQITKASTKFQVSTIIGFVVGAIATGVIGNRADTFFLWIWTLVATFVTASIWFWLCVLILVCASLLLLHRVIIANQALDVAEQMMKLDDSLLRLLPNLVPAKDRDNGVQRLLADVLRDTVETFTGQIHRASILLPDEQGILLKPWASYQMPADSITRTQFYIGSDAHRKRGIAGEAFVEREIIVGHIAHNAKDGHICDRREYIEFDSNRHFPPYRSLICVPIIGIAATTSGNNTVACIGVICFDSVLPTAFDSPIVQELLFEFSTRIAAVLQVYQQLPALSLLQEQSVQTS